MAFSTLFQSGVAVRYTTLDHRVKWCGVTARVHYYFRLEFLFAAVALSVLPSPPHWTPPPPFLRFRRLFFFGAGYYWKWFHRFQLNGIEAKCTAGKEKSEGGAESCAARP